VSRATEIYAREFDSVFFTLSPRICELIESKIHDLGARLGTYSHHRLKGRSEYRLRVGGCRIIYEFDPQRTFCIWLRWVIAAKFIAEPLSPVRSAIRNPQSAFAGPAKRRE
jgi:mRNA-degrading endonuclease RelE of RelBE toxin-antitoxin system